MSSYRKSPHITSFEVIQTTIFAAWTVGFWLSSKHYMGESSLYKQFVALAPWWYWSASALLNGATLLYAGLHHVRRLHYLMLFMCLSWWTLTATLTWQGNHTMFGPTAFSALALGAAIRYVELRMRR